MPHREPTIVRAAGAVLPMLLSACASTPYIERTAEDLAQRLLIVDTHIDTPYRLQADWEDVSQRTQRGDFDYVRARAGGLDAAFMSIYVPASYESNGARALADQLIDMVEALSERAPDKFAPARSPGDVRTNAARGLISLPMGMENGAPIEGDLANLRHFYDRGIRYITLAHSQSNHLSDSSFDIRRPWQGLSPFGREVVAEMNRLGIMIDVSHISDQAFYQVIELSRVPVIASHSSLRAFTPGFERNMSDDMIRALARQGGVIQINFGSAFLLAKANAWLLRYRVDRQRWLDERGGQAERTEEHAFEQEYLAQHPPPRAKLEDVLDRIDHAVRLAGVEHVGLGSDFDGVGDTLPDGLRDVSQYPNLVAGLLERGYSEADLQKILGDNLLRVWTRVEEFARARQAAQR